MQEWVVVNSATPVDNEITLGNLDHCTILKPIMTSQLPTEILGTAFREQRPVALLAGQNIDTAIDPILASLLSNLNCDDSELSWLAALKQGLNENHMEWLSERFERCVPSSSTMAIYDIPWSAIFTSSIDPRFSRRFETRGRQPETLLSRETYPRLPRSRSRPPIYYLLGKSSETVDYARAPRRPSDLQRRLSLHTSEFLNRIAETTTTYGVLVVAGYHPSTDWLPLDSLLAPLSDGRGPKVLWFSAPPTVQSELASEWLKVDYLF